MLFTIRYCIHAILVRHEQLVVFCPSKLQGKASDLMGSLAVFAHCCSYKTMLAAMQQETRTVNAGQPSSTQGESDCDRLCPHHTYSTQPACSIQVCSASTCHKTTAYLGCSVSHPYASSRKCLACMIHLLTHALCVSCSAARPKETCWKTG